VRRLVLLAVCLSVLASVCRAEPRWCSVTGRRPADMLLYPPIARAARVQGVVVSRIVYVPNGAVARVEPIFGPAMLSDSVSKQISRWIVTTDASGDELCESLLIAQFQFDEPGVETPTVNPAQGAPGILRVSVTSEVIVISDPGPDNSSNPFARLKRFVTWMGRKLRP